MPPKQLDFTKAKVGKVCFSYHKALTTNIYENPSLIQGGAKVGLQLWVHETIIVLLITVLFSIWTTLNLLLPHPVL